MLKPHHDFVYSMKEGPGSLVIKETQKNPITLSDSEEQDPMYTLRDLWKMIDKWR